MSIKINIQTGKQENIVVIDDTTKKVKFFKYTLPSFYYTYKLTELGHIVRNSYFDQSARYYLKRKQHYNKLGNKIKIKDLIRGEPNEKICNILRNKFKRRAFSLLWKF